MALQFENKEFVLKKELTEVEEGTTTLEEYASYQNNYDDETKVDCIMIATMTLSYRDFMQTTGLMR